MTAYYNEFEPYAVQWLRNLIEAGHLPQGEVDERDIRDVRPGDLQGFEQCHFFAGIGGWPLALRLAGWPDERPVWTGSCPCQPFSAAGKRKGTDDERHLWPDWYWLIKQCCPPVVFGEQVASKAGREWLAGVRLDMEALGHAFGAADLCAAGTGEEAEGRFVHEDNSFDWRKIVVGPPHIRQRLFWVAYSDDERCYGQHALLWAEKSRQREASISEVARSSEADRVAYDVGPGLERLQEQQARTQRETAKRGGLSGWMGYTEGDEQRWTREFQESDGQAGEAGGSGSRFWSEFDVMPCADGKARRVEPGTFPLAHGVPGRVGKLRAYGNAIVPQVAAEFIRAVEECRP